MKIGRILLAVLFVLVLKTGAFAYVLSDIELEAAYGTGANEALVIVDFSLAEDDSFAWKINFDSATYRSILDVIADNDSGFIINDGTGGDYVNSISYTDTMGNPHMETGLWYSHFSNDFGQSWSFDLWHENLVDGDTLGWANNENFDPPVAPMAQAVPVPGSALLLGTGLLMLTGSRKNG